MQDRTDSARLFGGDAVSLTRCAYGTRATISNAGRIDHTHRSIVFAASLLWRECCPLPTTQRAIGLWEKIVSPQTSYPCHPCPLWGTEGWFGHRKGRGELRFSSRGGKTR